MILCIYARLVTQTLNSSTCENSIFVEQIWLGELYLRNGEKWLVIIRNPSKNFYHFQGIMFPKCLLPLASDTKVGPFMENAENNKKCKCQEDGDYCAFLRDDAGKSI